MRTPSFFALAIVLASAGLAPRAYGQNYPWCAHYAMGGDEAVNCGFVTEEQCWATVRGIGGFCARNTTYIPAPPVTRPSHRLRPKPHPHPQ